MRMRYLVPLIILCCTISLAANGRSSPQSPGAQAAQPADLSRATPDELFKVYDQLANLAGSDQYAVTENATLTRDAGRLTFKEGRLAFAKPVAGRVVAAVFSGEGIFELDPPTEIDRRQISRFTREPILRDGFREAVFFFTDDSWAELAKQVRINNGGDSGAADKALNAAQKRFQNELNGWWANEFKGAFPTRNLAARMLADLSDPASKGLFLADIRSEHHDRLIYQVSWNRDGVLLPVFANDEEVMLMHWKQGEYSEWWSGFHLAGEYRQNPHPEHRTLLAHASDETIDADVTDNHISATAEIKFEVPEARIRVLPMTLDGVLRISSVTDESGNKLRFIQEPRESTSDPWIILPAPSEPGRSYTIKISYDEDSTHDSRVIRQQGAGLYYVGSRESWYPSFGAFDDRTHFVLNFKSPKRFVFVGTGRQENSSTEGKVLATRWESQIPYSVVGFNYGAFVSKSHADDNLMVRAYTGEQLPDPLVGIANSGVIGSISTASMAGYTADVSFQAFKLYEYYFGGLPFKSISVTEQPVFGFGQSWPTLVFLPFDSLLDGTIRHGLGMDRSAEAREFYNLVAVHEMSHQWWGHMVGWKTYHDQ